MAPKINAREKTRNRSQAKKRVRDRLLRTNLQPAAKSDGKPKPSTAAK